MLRKVKKYLKFVVCCALILSLIAPSYAALSASDGSAFVTKAEFDSALADFNARLTTFEAGINSKIDSQVTSYLDRNGIWNGQEVSFVSPWVKNTWRNETDFLNFAIWPASKSEEDDDLHFDELRDLLWEDSGVLGVENGQTFFIPSLLPDVIPEKYISGFGSSPLGRLIMEKSKYAKMTRYLVKEEEAAAARGDQYWSSSRDGDNWRTSKTGNLRTASWLTNSVELIMITGKPYKIIENVPKSGLMFLNFSIKNISDTGPYYGWQFASYITLDQVTYDNGWRLTSSVPHVLGALPTFGFAMDLCVGKDFADPTKPNGTIFTDANFKNYSKASISPITITKTIGGGNPKDFFGMTQSSITANQPYIYDYEKSASRVLLGVETLNVSQNSSTVLVFVNKGDDVWFVTNSSWSFGNNGGKELFYTSNWVVGGSAPGIIKTGSNYGPRVKMSASIY